MSNGSFFIPFPFVRKLSWVVAPVFSRFVCSNLLHKPFRATDAYVNFLMGKGSGAGWDIESEIAAAGRCILREDPVVFDVGANVGEWSQLFLKRVPTAHICMFEPLEQCRKEISKKGLNTRVFPYALSDSTGEVVFHFSSETDTMASIDQRRDSFYSSDDCSTVAIPTMTIDEFIEKENIEFVDLIKMDIEGHEFSALCGAKNSLKNGKIGGLTFEFGAGNINSRTFFHDFYDLLNEYGFDIFRIIPGGKLFQINEYYEDLEYFRGVSNYLALLKSHPYKK
jgi:FkbM family methyltransferase